jgi:putative endonuclease
VTSNLVKRVYEHKEKFVEGFAKTYDVDRLVYYEVYDDIRLAIEREKQLKKWKRDWKIALIERDNPLWADLYQGII